ncbi:hypothetical protein OsJ_20692 [Oryza sativa Japonica Group]|uniref:Uncharacterized protein n=1 Tax=Oryza sativa subsp. japonica TaxID=39947 RepID=B9FSC0_ORYSJ|nr:hypothetical protein OsJ_20692 [Oryza sativa Japonica Group]
MLFSLPSLALLLSGFFPEGSPRKPTWREEERVELQT